VKLKSKLMALVLILLTTNGCSKAKSIYLINYTKADVIIETPESNGRTDAVNKMSSAMLTCDMYIGGDLKLLVNSRGLVKEMVIDYQTMKRYQISDSVVVVELR